MNIIVAIDKFKGSCTGVEASDAVVEGIRKEFPTAKCAVFPISDGGDGFAAVLKHYLKTKTVRVQSQDPLGRKIRTSYQWQGSKKRAIIELASCSGLTLLERSERDPLKTSTYGTGMLIANAIRKGARKIILGLGGSATNDGGMGIAYGLGFQCYDGNNHLLEPIGENLIRIRKIIPPKKIPEVQFTICCDVENPLFGRTGAAFVFSPQKGARPADVIFLDKGLRNLSKQIAVHRRINISGIRGMGAAGGAMAFLYSYFNCAIERGADIVIRESKISRAIPKADLLITGEGTIDDQSLQGKVISRLMPLANEKEIPVMFVCGQWKRSAGTQKIWGDIPVLELLRLAGSKNRSMQKAIPLLRRGIAKKIKFHFNEYVD